MPHAPVWQGTPEELQQLLGSMQHNCSCEHDPKGALTTPCALHREPLSQQTLDKLLFMRRIAGRLVRTEWSEDHAL